MNNVVMLLAPGAGAPSTSAWMQGWKKRLEMIGEVSVLDYPYMLEKRRRPDPLPRLVAAHRAALAAVRAEHRGPVVLVGKSMGGRIGCHVALVETVDALVCLGYPLKGATGAVRDEVLLSLRIPILFVQGTRDPLCPLDLLNDVRSRMTAPNELHVVDSGNHSLEPTKTWLSGHGASHQDVEALIVKAVTEFVQRVIRGGH